MTTFTCRELRQIKVALQSEYGHSDLLEKVTSAIELLPHKQVAKIGNEAAEICEELQEHLRIVAGMAELAEEDGCEEDWDQLHVNRMKKVCNALSKIRRDEIN